MVIFIGLFIAGFGLMMYKFYRGYSFHHKIGIPIIILGLLISIGGVGFQISKKNAENIMNLSTLEIKKVTISSIYDPNDNFNEYSDFAIENPDNIKLFLETIQKGKICKYETGTIEWYMNLKIELESNEILYAIITKTENGFEYNQLIKFIITAGSDDYYCIDNISCFESIIK
ncbi:hypothetical protein [Labilibaculum antarcticum]|uniref:Uncharacterized protein n=1 Tax=Labilibaculum antarcticum TaxID=1717717 RepID=A0A1Y1CNH6_9BACT|nr:hypothetical protein [Labilibaculum antarcticum]BAX81824.1 hypothetical protein ALGA_3526 [Labilibaculum antarcticum]